MPAYDVEISIHAALCGTESFPAVTNNTNISILA
jgi:hypothetical protein